MNLSFKVAAACALLVAAPVSAQVVGGSGGLGGSLGGRLGGAAGGVGNVGGHLGSSLGGRAGGNVGGNVGGVGLGANTGVDSAIGANVGLDSRSGRFDAGSAVALNARTGASVDTGTVVRDTSGQVVGRVHAVRRTAEGAVHSVLVQVGDRVATLPAANFGVTGDVLVSAMSRADVRREARSQDRRQQSASRSEGRSRPTSNDGGAVRE